MLEYCLELLCLVTENYLKKSKKVYILLFRRCEKNEILFQKQVADTKALDRSHWAFFLFPHLQNFTSEILLTFSECYENWHTN